MADQLLLLLASAVLVQFVLGLFTFWDANRRGLEHPQAYFYGVTIPLLGVVVFAVYLARRDGLPTADLSPPSDSETADHVVWTVENRGLRRLPRRLSYTIQDGKTLWHVAVAVPPILLLLAALVDARITFVLIAFCGTFWLTYLGSSRAFTNTTIQLDPADGSLHVQIRGGDHPLSPSGSEHEIDLADVQRAELRRVGAWVVIKFAYEFSLSVEPRTLLVPPDRVPVVRSALARHEIPIRDRLGDGTGRSAIWQRYVGTTLSLVLVPSIAAFRWPEYAAAQPVPLLVLFTVLWLVAKFLSGVVSRLNTLLRLTTD